MGTSITLATMPTFVDRGIPHMFPQAPHHKVYEPVHPLKYGYYPPYTDHARVIVKALEGTRGDRKWCLLYQDDDLGAEVRQGAEAALTGIAKRLLATTSYKRGATDFSSQVAKLKSAGCDTVVMGTTVRETVGIMAEARKSGLAAELVGAASAYSDTVARLGGATVEGFEAVHGVSQPYADDPSPSVRDWVKRFQARFDVAPDVYGVGGYIIMGWIVAALEKAGPDLTAKGFVDAMERSSFPRDMLGLGAISVDMTFSPTKHLGYAGAMRISRIVNGKWTPVTDLISP
jgi:branched-chain amino acid transport system substrate-binding protein